MSSSAAEARRWYSATVASATTSRTSSRWCRTRRRAAGAGEGPAGEGGVSDEVVRGAVRDADGGDVAGPGRVGVRRVGGQREVDEAVVRRPAGQAGRGTVLAAFALGDEDLEDAALLAA